MTQTLHDIVEQLSKNKSVKTIRYNKQYNYCIVYFHRVGRHVIDDVIRSVVKNKNMLVSVLKDKNMAIIRERT